MLSAIFQDWHTYLFKQRINGTPFFFGVPQPSASNLQVCHFYLFKLEYVMVNGDKHFYFRLSKNLSNSTSLSVCEALLLFV